MTKIVLIGGSFGALKALQIILPTLPHDFPAAILIVTHIGPYESIAPEILSRCSAIPVVLATDGEPIVPGRVLVAPPDEHLTVSVENGNACVRLVHGPKENHCRPAIDPLFRSAASAFQDDAIGVILTGYLDDGTVGLQAIKSCGGLAIVQDPIEAEAVDMPASAIEHVNVDRVLRAREIGPALIELTGKRVEVGGAGNKDFFFGSQNWIDIENRIAGKDSDMDDLERIGRRSSLTCPECSGALWEINRTRPLRYRCHTGHAFTAKVLEALQRDVVEDAIWGAIRALHEQERLFSTLSEKASEPHNAEKASEYKAKAMQAKAHSQTLREVIASRTLMAKDEGSS
jgi:two-component system chemotaxis response regulator CheB